MKTSALRLRVITMLMIAGLLAAVAGAATPAAEGANSRHVRIAILEVFSYAPYLVADELNLWANHGLSGELVPMGSSTDALVALVSGSAEFAGIGTENVFRPRAEGIPLVAVHNAVNRMTMEMVVRNELVERLGLSRNMPIQDRLQALRGMTIGTTGAGAASEVYSRYYFGLAGLDPDRDATFVSIGGPPALIAALARGDIDAFQLSSPTGQIVEQRQVGRIIISSARGDVPGLDDYPFVVTATTEERIRQDPDLVEAVARALAEANDVLRNDPERALEALSRYWNTVDPHVLREALAASGPAFAEGGRFTPEGWVNAHRTLATFGMAPGQFDTSEGVAWTNRFVR